MPNPACPKIGITIGDPAGIGPEIVLKAVATPSIRQHLRPVVFGDFGVLRFYLDRLSLPLALHPIQSADEAQFRVDTVDVVEVASMPLPALKPGSIAGPYGRAMLAYTEAAVQAAMAGSIDAVVAAPHTKEAVELSGVAFDGYPGLLARLTHTPVNQTFLMLSGRGLRMVNATLHLPLHRAIECLTPELLALAFAATDHALRQLGVARPRIAVAGLNPHAGENGLFGHEEQTTIGPAIDAAKEHGLQIEGPFPSDSWLLRHREVPYDAYVAMYHDQAHIPMKLLAPDAVSAFTIGTPILFSSVGHGSALDIAGQGIARAESIMATLELVAHSGRPPKNEVQ